MKKTGYFMNVNNLNLVKYLICLHLLSDKYMIGCGYLGICERTGSDSN